MKLKPLVEKSKRLFLDRSHRLREQGNRLWDRGGQWLQQSKHLMEWVVPDPQTCRAAADRLRAAHPGQTGKQLAHHHLRELRKQGAKVGGVTGVFANPALMIPAAAADAGYVLKLEGQLAGDIAALLDPAALENEEAFRADVLSIVFPSAASQALRAVAGVAAEETSRVLVRRFLSRQISEATARFALKKLTGRMVEKTATHAVPLLGVGIGAGWNWNEIGQVGRRAIHYYTAPRPALPPGA
jgi:hypothetical protein